MPKHPVDPDHKGFDFRSGFGGIPAWMGVNKQGSTANIPTTQIREGINIRPFQLGYVGRGGLTKQNPLDSLTGTVVGIFDAGDPGAP